MLSAVKPISHYITLERYRKTASISRSGLVRDADRSRCAPRLANVYALRYDADGDWFTCDHADGAAKEWLYFDADGIPSLYYCAESGKLILF